MKGFCIAIAIAIAPAASAQPVAADMEDLRTAYGLLIDGEFESAAAAYGLIRSIASDASVQQSAAEGEAAAQVAALRRDVEAAAGGTVALRLLSIPRRRLLATLDGELAGNPSAIMGYIYSAAVAEGPLRAEDFVQHPDAAQMARPLDDPTQPFLTQISTPPEPVAEPAPQDPPAPPPDVADAMPELSIVRREMLTNDGSQYMTLANSLIRSSPGRDGARLGSVLAGEVLSISARLTMTDGEQWMELSNGVGFILADLLQQVTAIEAAPPVQIRRGTIPNATQFAPTVAPVAPPPAPVVTGCSGSGNSNYRVLRVIPVFDSPGGAQLSVKRVGTFVRNVIRVDQGYLVFREVDETGAPVCRYAPMGENAINVVRLPD